MLVVQTKSHAATTAGQAPQSTAGSGRTFKVPILWQAGFMELAERVFSL